MRRGVPQQIVLVAFGAIASLPACGFPSLSYEDAVDAASDGRTQDGATGSDSTSPLDAATGDGATDGMGEGSEASVDAPTDAPVPPEAGFDSGNPCDVDGDGHLAKGACGGDDCCDTDWSAHPGLSPTTWFTKMADQCGSWDYNCDGTVEEELAVTLTCGGLAATGCTGGVHGLHGGSGCGNPSGAPSICARRTG